MRGVWLWLASLLTIGDAEHPGAELIAAQVRALELEPLAVGARGELSLVLLEAPDREMPLEVRIDAGALELEDNRLGWSFVVDPLALQPRVRTSFRAPKQPGVHEVRARVAYSVCDEQWCRRKSGEVRWTVAVIPDRAGDGVGSRDMLQVAVVPASHLLFHAF